MTEYKATHTYLKQTRQQDWNFVVAVNLIKSEAGFTNEQAFSKLDSILSAYDNPTAKHWKNNWKTMIKAYDKLVDKESSNSRTKSSSSRTKSSSSRTTIGTQVNTNIRAVKAHQFVNYA